MGWLVRTYDLDGKPGPWRPTSPPADAMNLRPCRIVEYRLNRNGEYAPAAPGSNPQ